MRQLAGMLWHSSLWLALMLYLIPILDGQQVKLVDMSDLAHNKPSACPHSCSGHGYCNDGTTCLCFDSWHGGAADCSMRECAKGVAWADKASDTNTGHQTVECSAAGHCNRATGNCECFPGFSGHNCQRLTCANACNMRGVCSTINDIHTVYGMDYFDTSTRLSGADLTKADGSPETFTSWEKDSVTMCDCPIGWTGFDCGERMCPKADDPLTTGQSARKFVLSVTSTSAMGGTLKVQFQNDKSISLSLAAADRTAALCKKGFEASPKIKEVTCAVSGTDTDSDFTVELVSFPYYSNENNIFSHDGNPSLSDFYCDTSSTTGGVACLFEESVDTNVKEYTYCANRGICDFDTGLCECFHGFGGVACEELTHDPKSPIESQPAEKIHVSGLDFTSSVLQIGSERSANSAFKMIECIANDEVIFEVKGDGSLKFPKLSVETGGLQIASGGLTVSKDGMLLKSDKSSSTDSVLGASTVYTSADAIPPIAVYSQTTQNAASFLVGAFNQAQKMFTIRNDGNTNFWSVGLSLTGGQSVQSDGFKVSGGITILEGGVKVNGGATISLDGLRVTGATSVLSGGMRIENGGQTISAGGFRIINGGATLQSDGMKVTAGGMSIENDGLTITQGMSVMSGGLQVTGGMSLLRQGFYVTGGTTIAEDGLRVTGGFTMPDVNDMIITTTEDDYTGQAASYTSSMDLTVGTSSGDGPGGSLTIESGRGEDTSSGAVVIATADGCQTSSNCQSGSLQFYTGASTGANSGAIWIGTGSSTDESAGGIIIKPGSIGGDENLINAPPVLMNAGNSEDTDGATGGRILVMSGKSSEGSSGAIVGTTPAGGTSGQSGDIYLSTGSKSSTPSYGNSGMIYVGTGSATSGAGGAVSITVGKTALGSGSDLTVQSGKAKDAAGGRIAVISGASAESHSGNIGLITPNAGSTGASGALILSTGTSTTANSGAIYIGTGGAASGAGGDITITVGEGDQYASTSAFLAKAGTTTHAASTGGKLSIVGGFSAESSSGAVVVQTADATSADAGGTSGTITVQTGLASADSSGAIYIGTGNSDSGQSGNIQITVGEGDTGEGGTVTFTAGESNTNKGGDVYLISGDATTLPQKSGDIVFIPGTSSAGTVVPGKFEIYPYSGASGALVTIGKEPGIRFIDTATSTAYL